MKTIALFCMALLAISLVAPGILAQDELTADADLEAEVEAGVGPNSAFHSWDRGFERLRLSFTRDKVARARLHLLFAQERLAEAEAMLDEGNDEAADVAQELHDEELSNAESEIDEVEEGEDEGESQEALDRVSDLRLRLLAHRERVDRVHERILDRLSDKNISQERLDHLTEVFDRISDRSAEVESRVDEKRDRIRTKYKVLSEKSEDELTEEEAAFLARIDAHKDNLMDVMERRDAARDRIRDRIFGEDSDVSLITRVRLALADARTTITLADIRIANADDSDRSDRLEEARDTFRDASVSLERGDLEEALELARESDRLARDSVEGLSIDAETRVSGRVGGARVDAIVEVDTDSDSSN